MSTWLTQQANCFISGSTRRLHFGANCWQSDCLSVLLTDFFYFWKRLSCCCNFWSIKLYNNPTSCSQQMREKRFKWKFFSRVVTGESLHELCAILIWYTNDLAKRHIFLPKCFINQKLEATHACCILCLKISNKRHNDKQRAEVSVFFYLLRFNSRTDLK